LVYLLCSADPHDGLSRRIELADDLSNRIDPCIVIFPASDRPLGRIAAKVSESAGDG